jgi:dTDP-glucose 4,6-dehydratase
MRRARPGGDRLAHAYHETYALPVVVTRCSNNYGPRQYPEKLVPLFITNAIDGEPLPVYGTGLNRRDWLHVRDHCDALIALLGHPGVEGETFNIGGDHERNVLEVTEQILERLDRPRSLIRHVEDRPGHDRRYAVDWSKLSRVTGWRPEVPFEPGSATRSTGTAPTKRGGAHQAGEFKEYYTRMYGKRKVLKEVQA